MAYRALARKYRSRTFGELIGQDVLVRTLSNAIEKGRIHHAYMLTGVRGIGKTSTARIMAKAINYAGPDGTGKPTTDPTDDCAICQAIGEDRHPDVIEIDAASNTGVDDVRQIIENARYAPVQARYKVFIIDEVHMLSKQAFNALLKTLEEPPPHVVFILATTEIRKVPVTILSRCQRFDLRRIDVPTLTAHYRKVADAENIRIEDEALQIIAQAADGSARDGLSLLDQAIAQADDQSISAAAIRKMLGRSDNDAIGSMFDAIMRNDSAAALATLDQFYRNGAEPAAVLDDLLEFNHLITRIKVTPQLSEEPGLNAALRERAKEFAHTLQISSLSRIWQMLLKAVQDVALAPHPQQALEMAVIRIAFAAPLPPLEDLLKKIPALEMPAMPAASSALLPPPPQPPPQARLASVPSGSAATNVRAVSRPERLAEIMPQELAQDVVAIHDFAALVNLCEEKNEPMLAADLFSNVRPVKFQQGQMQIALQRGASKDLIGTLQKKLQDWTGQRWMIAVASTGGDATLAEQQTDRKKTAIAAAYNDPAIAAFKTILSDFTITDIKMEQDP